MCILLYKNVLKLCNYFWIFLLLLITINFCACTSFVKDDHPEYFKAAFEKFDSTINDEGMAELNAVFYAFPNPGTGDKAGQYLRICEYYISFKRTPQSAMPYADSLIALLEKRQNDKRFNAVYAKALFMKGDIYFGMLDYDKAFKNFISGKQALQKDPQNKCELFAYTSRIASLTYSQSKYLIAASYYAEVCRELEHCWQGDFGKFAEMQGNLDNVALCYTKMGMYDSAQYYFNSALDFIAKNEHLFPQNKPYMDIARAVIYGNQADAFAGQKHYKDAEKLYSQSIKVTIIQDKYFTLSTQIALAELYIQSRQLNKTDSMLDEMEPQVFNGTINRTIMAFLKARTDYFIHTKQLDSAFVYQQKYLAVKDSLQERNKKFSTLNINSEFETREQKAINALLEKDNELKNVYLIVSVLASIMCVVILLLVWQNLRRAGRHVKELESLNMQVNVKNVDLQRAFLSLEQSHTENSRIMRIVAHDLRNPISAIHNITFLLLKKDNPAPLKDVLTLIKDACFSSLGLIKDILNQGHDMREIHTELVDMRKLLEYCVELLQLKADEKKQQIKLESDEVNVKLNRQKMWRVISNIVTNAIKFSPQRADIDIKLERRKDSILLSVRDRGIGIPEELKYKIFAMAPEAGRLGTGGEESYGLGLSISKKIIEEHNGKLWFESVRGEGSVFYVELPC